MQSNRWSTAATSGLLLALVTIISSLVQAVFEPNNVINIVIWTLRSVGSIWLLLYFIKEYAKPFNFFTFKDGFHYGSLIAFFSSFICAVYITFHFTIIFPDAMTSQIDKLVEAMATSNPDMIDSLDKVIPKLPLIISFFTFIYYSLIGVVASAIMANYTKKGSIFDEPTNL